LTGLNYVVDNTANRVMLIVLPGTNDNTNAIAGAKVVYRLQVSPAPATADFADVPTSHPFFQFIEALYHSGITAGCGGGNFCPDNPLTRGQMAGSCRRLWGSSSRETEGMEREIESDFRLFPFRRFHVDHTDDSEIDRPHHVVLAHPTRDQPQAAIPRDLRAGVRQDAAGPSRVPA
jgi:hypothetical protein